MTHLARVAALLLVCAGGCAKAPFTTSVLASYGLSSTDLARIQFFTSERIVLEREVSRQGHERDGAEVRLQTDTHTEVIEVSDRMPCVVLRVEGDYLLLGFSPRDLRASLWFAAEPVDDGAEAERRYMLTALENAHDEAARDFTPRFSRGFLVSWSGNKYRVAEGRGAYLLYQVADDSRDRVEVHPPGWRLSDRAPPKPASAPPTTPPAEPDPNVEPEL